MSLEELLEDVVPEFQIQERKKLIGLRQRTGQSPRRMIHKSENPKRSEIALNTYQAIPETADGKVTFFVSQPIELPIEKASQLQGDMDTK